MTVLYTLYSVHSVYTIERRTKRERERIMERERDECARSERDRVILKYFATANRKSTINVFTLKAFALNSKGLILGLSANSNVLLFSLIAP